jgi:hypothetical protein
MPGQTFTLSEYPLEMVELAWLASGTGDCARRG